MTQYRKKPVVIEAWKWDGSLDLARSLYNEGLVMDSGYTSIHGELPISTLEGTMLAQPGDYIIRGVKGEFYPCKSDIFHATYEEV